MIKNEQLSALMFQIDSGGSTADKLERLRHWFLQLPEVIDFRVLCFSLCMNDTTSDFVHFCSASNSNLFPSKPALLNGHSAVPKEIFPQKLRHDVTVYYPFVGRGGEMSGALLLKCTKPENYVNKNSSTLEIVASKIGDILRIANLKKKLKDEEGSSGTEEQSAGGISPEFMSRFMDKLDLPMYISDRRGDFISVNGRFLQDFSFGSVDQANQEDPFFLDNDTWRKGVETILSKDISPGITMKVRCGDGRSRIVKNSATLIGAYTLGILFDITSYTNWNEELQEKVEELSSLNDKLKATTHMLQKTQSTAMKSLAKLAEYRDMETGNHLHRICEFNRLLSSRVRETQPYTFHIADEYVQDIYLSGMLHDIGKVGVPDQILLKPKSLSEQEWDIMKKHTIWGWDLLREADQELGEQSFLTLASRIALSHHEHYDGTGYPKKLKGEDIPLSARISAVSDVYDALTSKRPYKDAWSHEHAIEEIIKQKGRQFDPALIDILENIEADFHRIKLDLPDSSMVN